MKSAISILIAVLVAPVVLFVLVRLLEPRFAFFPFSGETTTPREFGVDYDQLSISTADGEQLRGWMLPHRAPRALVVYFHGNGGNLSIWADVLAGIARHGYSVFAFDYRGYGLSTGRPTERGLYRDVDAVLEHVWKHQAQSRAAGSRTAAPVVYWGRSLGAVMAAYAAAAHPSDGLVLESGFPDARSLLRASPPLAFLSLFSTYRFPAADFLERVTAPVLVMHGDADSVIPFEHGRALFERVTGPRQFVVIRGGDHNDPAPPDPDAYWRAVDAFVESLMKRSRDRASSDKDPGAV